MNGEDGYTNINFYKFPREVERKMKKLMAAMIILGALYITSCAPTTSQQGTSVTVKKHKRTYSPDSAKIWFSVGKDYLNKKKYDDAIRNFKVSIEYDSTFIPAYLNLAWAYLQKAQTLTMDTTWKIYYDSASTVYRKIAKINPQDSRGWQGLGFMYGIYKNDVDSGIYFYRKALQVDPNNNDARYGLAKLLDRAGRKDEAEKLYKEALARDPDNPGLNKSYGKFLTEQGRYDEAVPYIEKVLPKTPNDIELITYLAKGYEMLAKKAQDPQEKTEYVDKALQYYGKLITNKPDDYTLYMKKGDLLLLRGDVDGALAAYDKAIELAPNSPYPYLKKVAAILDKKHDQLEARKILLKAISLEIPDPVLKAAAYALLADTYIHSGRQLYKKAKKERIREYYKDAMDNYDQAIKYFKKVLEIEGAGKWKDYAQKQLLRAEKLRKFAYRKYVGIE